MGLEVDGCDDVPGRAVSRGLWKLWESTYWIVGRVGMARPVLLEGEGVSAGMVILVGCKGL